MQHIQTKKKKYKEKGEKIYKVMPVFYGAYTLGHVWYSFTTAHTSAAMAQWGWDWHQAQSCRVKAKRAQTKQDDIACC